MRNDIIAGQGGIAMVLSLMVILALTVMVSGMMISVVNDKVITANHVRDAQALSISKAGTAEAMRRLGYPYMPGNDTVIVQDLSVAGSLNPNWQVMIFSDAPTQLSSGPVVFKRSLQPARPLTYSCRFAEFIATGDTNRVLRVRYKTYDANGNGVLEPNEVYYYDYVRKQITLGITGSTPSDAYPVWQIISPARVGNARRALITEVVVPRYNVQSRAAVNTDGAVEGNGTADICGHNHPYNTPWNTEPPSCFDLHHFTTGTPHGDQANNWKSGTVVKPSCTAVGCMPGVETQDTVTYKNHQDHCWGNPDERPRSGRAVPEIWDLLGMPKAKWDQIPFSSSGTVRVTSLTKNNAAETKLEANYNHEGVLYCQGDLRMVSNWNFKGLIYVEGDVKGAGNPWILGGIIVKGQVHTTSVQGTWEILYSSEAIARAVQRVEGTRMSMVSQREFLF